MNDNPNFIAPTPPAGDNSHRIATTAFVTGGGGGFPNTIVVTDYSVSVVAAGSNPTTLLVLTAQTLTSAGLVAGVLTVPANVATIIGEGGSIAKGAATSLLIQGPFQAWPTQVFNSFTAGDVKFGILATQTVLPEWFSPCTTAANTQTAVSSAVLSLTVAGQGVGLHGRSYDVNIGNFPFTIGGTWMAALASQQAVIVSSHATNPIITGTSGNGIYFGRFAVVRSASPGVGSVGMSFSNLGNLIIEKVVSENSLIQFLFNGGVGNPIIIDCQAGIDAASAASGLTFYGFKGVGPNASLLIRGGEAFTPGFTEASGTRFIGAHFSGITADTFLEGFQSTNASIGAQIVSNGDNDSDISISYNKHDSFYEAGVDIANISTNGSVSVLGGEYAPNEGATGIVRVGVRATNSSNVIVKGAQIFKRNTSSAAPFTGVIFDNCSDFEAEGNIIKNAGISVYAGGPGGNGNITNNVISNQVFPSTAAILVTSAAHDVVAAGNSIRGTAQIAVGIQVDAGTSNNKIGLNPTNISRTSTVTITIASPAIVSWTAHGLPATAPVVFTTTGTLPTNITAGVTYYVIAAGLTANAFQVSATVGGAAVNTSGSQSGVHTAQCGTAIVDNGTGTIITRGNAGDLVAGTLPDARLSNVVAAAGPTGSDTDAPIVTIDAKGRVTALSSATITPAVGSVTGLGTGVATALAVNVGSAGAIVVFGGALGSPSSVGALPAHSWTGTVDAGANQLNNVVIGAINPGPITATTLAATVTTITAQSTNAQTVGRAGASNPAWQIDTNTALSATGLKLTAAAAGNGVALAAITSGTNENLTIDAAGSGPITLGGASTGNIVLNRDAHSVGNVVFDTAAKTVTLKQGANGTCGTFVCNGATPVTVNNTNVAITDVIFTSLNTVGGTVGATPSVKTITAGVGFTIAGTASDTSTYNYAIIKNAA